MDSTSHNQADGFDIAAIRRDFPILEQQVNGCRLAFLDNAASSQRPVSVIEAVNDYYLTSHANVHRGVHTLSQRATDLYEGAREKIRAFINAGSTREVIYTSGTTESINLLAYSFGSLLQPGDEIIVSRMEHHSNIVPWKLLAERSGVVLRVAPINERGELLLDELQGLINNKTKLISVAHVSNALGTINPVKDIVAMAKRHGVPVLRDGAQAAPHETVDVQDLDCDFYAFSGHKMCGPTGIGVLYAKEAWLNKLPPFMSGGEMVLAVSFERTDYNDLPWRFEAGTPPIAQAIGLGAAIDYLNNLGMDNIAAYEHHLLESATASLSEIEGLRIIGTAEHKAAVVSFVFDDIHPHDIGTVLDHQGVAIRTGHHCANPVMEFFGVAGTARASLAFYNDQQDIDQLVNALQVAVGMFR